MSPEPAVEPQTEPSTEPGTEPATEPGTEPGTEPKADLSANREASVMSVALTPAHGVTSWNTVAYSARTAPFSPNFTNILQAMHSFAQFRQRTMTTASVDGR
jgi:hypothetical protein